MTQLHEHEVAAGFLNEWYPCTSLLLGDYVDIAIRQFCDQHSAHTGLDAAADAQGWLTCLLEVIHGETGLPAYAEDVATYEEARAALILSEGARLDALFVAEQNASMREVGATDIRRLVPVAGRHARVDRYAFDAPGIVAAIEDCDRLEGLETPAPCFVLMFLPHDHPLPRPLIISSGIQMLFELCDGCRDCAAIVQCMRMKTGNGQGDDFEQRALQAFEMLRVRNVLTYREPAGRP